VEQFPMASDCDEFNGNAHSTAGVEHVSEPVQCAMESAYGRHSYRYCTIASHLHHRPTLDYSRDCFRHSRNTPV